MIGTKIYALLAGSQLCQLPFWPRLTSTEKRKACDRISETKFSYQKGCLYSFWDDFGRNDLAFTVKRCLWEILPILSNLKFDTATWVPVTILFIHASSVMSMFDTWSAYYDAVKHPQLSFLGSHRDAMKMGYYLKLKWFISQASANRLQILICITNHVCLNVQWSDTSWSSLI